MAITLKPYQEQAVALLATTVRSLLDRPGQGELCVFKAPTGSGKTVMTAKFIERLIADAPDEDMCFLWVSIGKGDLHLQSKKALQRIYSGFPTVMSVEDEVGGIRDSIARNEVLVVNWEKLRAKDRATGDWKNLAMKDGEKTNFREIIERTRELRRVVLVIDESHVSADSARAQELRAIINADVVVEMSATPKLLPTGEEVAEGSAAIVKVNPNDVIAEGMIKKELIINQGVNELSNDEADSQLVILEAAFAKREELRSKLAAEGSDINPLVLIQIPSADAGDIKKAAVQEFLASKGVTEKNGRLAIWLAEQKSETVDRIAEDGNSVEFLIFKQAVDTGWDCPRAHILVKLREIKSLPFEIQTVGRILRMPEQFHYSDEALNRGYIYTNLTSISVKKEDYNPNIIKHLFSKLLRERYELLKLSSYYKSRADYGDITASFIPVFEARANKFFGIKGDNVFGPENAKKVEAKGVTLDRRKFAQDVIKDTAVDSKRFDELQGEITAADRISLKVGEADLQDMFDQIIKDNLGSFRGIRRSVPQVKVAIYAWFGKWLGSKQWEDEHLTVQKVILHNGNRKVFERVLTEAVRDYQAIKEEEVKAKVASSEQVYDFEIPVELFFNDQVDEEVKSSRYIHKPCYLEKARSTPERNFEKHIDSLESVDWWWKNGENKKDYFGIRYEYEGSVSTFYPDYLIRLKDGRIGILETKDKADKEGKSRTKAKSEALQAWILEQGRPELFGGIIVERDRAWRINKQPVYDWGRTEQGIWSDWEDLEL